MWVSGGLADQIGRCASLEEMDINMSVDNNSSQETLSVHAGVHGGRLRPAVGPIYQTSTFSFDNVDQGAALFAGRE